MTAGNRSTTRDAAEIDTDAGPVAVHEGVTYADRDAGELKLDLYVPAVDDPPLVVYVHGGGWIAETRDNVPDPARHATAWGCAVASVSYRLQTVPAVEGDDAEGDPTVPTADRSNPTPRGRFPDHFVDVKASIRWLRAHAPEYGYDAEAVAAWGASAGGHLALLAGLVDDVTDLGPAFETELTKAVAPSASGAVQSVVAWYPVTDFALAAEGDDEGEADASNEADEGTDGADGADDGIVPLLLGGPPSAVPERYAQASPVTHVDATAPPTLLMHGRADSVVDVAQSRRLFDALDRFGVEAVRYELHELDHVWADDVDDIESERVAMDLISADPVPAQSVSIATHAETGEAPDPLLASPPPAGPEAIGRFLAETVGASGGSFADGDADEFDR